MLWGRGDTTEPRYRVDISEITLAGTNCYYIRERRSTMIEVPSREALESVNDCQIEEFPRMTRVQRHRTPSTVTDIEQATNAALTDLDGLDHLPDEATVGITAGSRGIHDITPVLSSLISTLSRRNLQPFVFPAMGSHGGATADGQRGMLAELGLTEETLGCEIRSSMAVETVGYDDEGRPVYAAEDALSADAILVVNRVKPHTDFSGSIESGLCKMTVIGIGKQRGANEAHNAALASSFRDVIPERTRILVEELPILGGIAIIENAKERAAEIIGVEADSFVEREPELLERATKLMPMLLIEDLDLLILDEIGKNVSGTGMDTNVVGRMQIYGEPEFETPDITRIYVRRLTDETHGNANGIGLADFAHRRVLNQISLQDTYVNCITGGQPERGQLPVMLPADVTALRMAYSTTGVSDPGEMRIARIQNTLETDELLVSEPVARELENHPQASVGNLRPLSITDGAFDVNPDGANGPPE